MILREAQGYKLEKVKRNFEGSYAITKDGKKSKCQYNTGTVKKVLMKMTDDEFVQFAKTCMEEEEDRLIIGLATELGKLDHPININGSHKTRYKISKQLFDLGVLQQPYDESEAQCQEEWVDKLMFNREHRLFNKVVAAYNMEAMV